LTGFGKSCQPADAVRSARLLDLTFAGDLLAQGRQGARQWPQAHDLYLFEVEKPFEARSRPSPGSRSSQESPGTCDKLPATMAGDRALPAAKGRGGPPAK